MTALGGIKLDLSMKGLVSLTDTRGHKTGISCASLNIFIINVFPKIHRGILLRKVRVSFRG